MAATAEVSYAESLAKRGLCDAEKRATLSDRILDANEALSDASGDWANALASNLEGHDEPGVKGDLLEAFEKAQQEFAEAARAATAFLRGEC